MKVELKHLTKVFEGKGKNAKPVYAVNDVSLTVEDGKLVGLLGPSGCGKSTALNLISGLLAPTEGQIFFGEDDVTCVPPEQRGVGLVFQNYALYPHLTVRDNILFPLQNLRGKDKLSKEEMLDRMQTAARLVQIEGLLDRKPAELSGGQQQRVAIARAIVKLPRVLLLDEPLSNLDARLRLQTREEIRRIQRETGITTVFVTHDQDEAMSISDMIIVMKDGVVQQVGAPQDVYDAPVNLFVAKFLGVPPINVFNARIEGGVLYIGDDALYRVSGIEDKEVIVGIRAEGFEPHTNATRGVMHCICSRVEVMGRDSSLLLSHPAALADPFRAIMDSEEIASLIPSGEAENTPVACEVKPSKLYIFDKESELRLDCTLEDIK